MDRPVGTEDDVDDAPSLLTLLGAGDDGADGMQPFLDESSVQWAILRFDLGSGSFSRQKVVFMHFNGERCAPVRRGWVNACTKDVQHILRTCDDFSDSFHAAIEVTRKMDATAQKLLEKVKPLFVSDHLGDHSVQWAKHGGVAGRAGILQRRSSAPPIMSQEVESAARCVPGHLSQQMYSSGREALHAVADPYGKWSWVLVGPNVDELSLVAGGSGSVDEIRKCLADHEDEVLFGLLRMSFGTGRLRRTKHVFLHICGAKVPAVRRGQLALLRQSMKEALSSFAFCSVNFFDASAEDITLEAVVERVRRAVVVDDKELGADKNSKKVFSVDAFREALLEDSAVTTAEPSRPRSKTSTEHRRVPAWSVEDARKLVHQPCGPLNWALFGVKDIHLLRRRSSSRKFSDIPRQDAKRGSVPAERRCIRRNTDTSVQLSSESARKHGTCSDVCGEKDNLLSSGSYMTAEQRRRSASSSDLTLTGKNESFWNTKTQAGFLQACP
eukprot:TRINITY_DN63519_c0_g1_i1.p1 TRINITY_DN63519_c0_g1~~TRINITY_DN63519_c0_g1_i1.p1  ORF type:complete len:498 (-),score=88.89 TRINITY_DN63519_c0_g1_i1:149-1642(-)